MRLNNKIQKSFIYSFYKLSEIILLAEWKKKPKLSQAAKFFILQTPTPTHAQKHVQKKG